MPHQKHRWTGQEVDFLKHNMPALTIKEVAALLGRSEDSVRSKCIRNEIKIPEQLVEKVTYRSKYRSINIKYNGDVIGNVDASFGLQGLRSLLTATAHNLFPALLRGNSIVIEAD